MIHANRFMNEYKTEGLRLIEQARKEEDTNEQERLRHEASIYFGLAGAAQKRGYQHDLVNRTYIKIGRIAPYAEVEDGNL